MHILLINTNPVVSRLLALCTRDADMLLEETTDINVQQKYYDIVFVDEESYKDGILQLDEYIKTGKKVLISNEESTMNIFDITIKKPFLPSEIIALLEQARNDKKIEEEEVSLFPLDSNTPVDEKPQILDSTELEKIKELLDMEDESDALEILTEDEIEARKIEVIKEQLIADGLEILDEDEIVKELSEKEDIKIFDIEPLAQEETLQIIKLKKKSKKKVKNKKAIKYTEEELEKIEDAIETAIVTLKRKKMKKLLNGEKIKVTVQTKGQDR